MTNFVTVLNYKNEPNDIVSVHRQPKEPLSAGRECVKSNTNVRSRVGRKVEVVRWSLKEQSNHTCKIGLHHGVEWKQRQCLLIS